MLAPCVSPGDERQWTWVATSPGSSGVPAELSVFLHQHKSWHLISTLSLGRFHSISYNRRLKRVSVGGHPPSCVAWHYLEALSCSASWHNWAHSLKIPRKDFFSFSFPKNHLNWEVGFCLCKTHQDLLLPLPTPRQSCLPCSSSQWLKTMSQAFIASLVFCC